MTSLRLGFFASGNGTNLQAILDACAGGTLGMVPSLLIGNNSGAFAFERARKASVPTAHLSTKTHPDPDDLDQAILQSLLDHQVDLIALVGYNKKLGPKTVAAFRHRILNIHPGLLPAYGGEGFYGLRVHDAVLKNGELESGATILLVDENYDSGPVVAEARVPVLAGDTPESLMERVHSQEYPLWVTTLRRIETGEIDLDAIS